MDKICPIIDNPCQGEKCEFYQEFRTRMLHDGPRLEGKVRGYVTEWGCVISGSIKKTTEVGNE